MFTESRILIEQIFRSTISVLVGLSFSELVFPRTSGPEITSNVRIEILMVRHAAEKSERRVFRLVRTARVLRTTSLLL